MPVLRSRNVPPIDVWQQMPEKVSRGSSSSSRSSAASSRALYPLSPSVEPAAPQELTSVETAAVESLGIERTLATTWLDLSSSSTEAVSAARPPVPRVTRTQKTKKRKRKGGNNWSRRRTRKSLAEVLAAEEERQAMQPALSTADTASAGIKIVPKPRREFDALSTSSLSDAPSAASTSDSTRVSPPDSVPPTRGASFSSLTPIEESPPPSLRAESPLASPNLDSPSVGMTDGIPHLASTQAPIPEAPRSLIPLSSMRRRHVRSRSWPRRATAVPDWLLPTVLVVPVRANVAPPVPESLFLPRPDTPSTTLSRQPRSPIDLTALPANATPVAPAPVSNLTFLDVLAAAAEQVERASPRPARTRKPTLKRAAELEPEKTKPKPKRARTTTSKATKTTAPTDRRATAPKPEPKTRSRSSKPAPKAPRERSKTTRPKSVRWN